MRPSNVGLPVFDVSLRRNCCAGRRLRTQALREIGASTSRLRCEEELLILLWGELKRHRPTERSPVASCLGLDII